MGALTLAGVKSRMNPIEAAGYLAERDQLRDATNLPKLKGHAASDGELSSKGGDPSTIPAARAIHGQPLVNDDEQSLDVRLFSPERSLELARAFWRGTELPHAETAAKLDSLNFPSGTADTDTLTEPQRKSDDCPNVVDPSIVEPAVASTNTGTIPSEVSRPVARSPSIAVTAAFLILVIATGAGAGFWYLQHQGELLRSPGETSTATAPTTSSSQAVLSSSAALSALKPFPTVGPADPPASQLRDDVAAASEAVRDGSIHSSDLPQPVVATSGNDLGQAALVATAAAEPRESQLDSAAARDSQDDLLPGSRRPALEPTGSAESHIIELLRRSAMAPSVDMRHPEPGQVDPATSVAPEVGAGSLPVPSVPLANHPMPFDSNASVPEPQAVAEQPPRMSEAAPPNTPSPPAILLDASQSAKADPAAEPLPPSLLLPEIASDDRPQDAPVRHPPSSPLGNAPAQPDVVATNPDPEHNSSVQTTHGDRVAVPSLSAKAMVPESLSAASDAQTATAASRPYPSAISPPVRSAEAVPSLEPIATLDMTQAAAMLRRANSLVAAGDVSGARLFYERLAVAGYRQAAIALGRTYDSSWLRQNGVVGVPPDPARAAHWRERATAMPDGPQLKP